MRHAGMHSCDMQACVHVTCKHVFMQHAGMCFHVYNSEFMLYLNVFAPQYFTHPWITHQHKFVRMTRVWISSYSYEIQCSVVRFEHHVTEPE